MARLTPAEALARTDAVLLDVRDPEAFAAGHAPGALSVPLAALEAGAPLPAAAEGRPVVAICRSGRRSRDAAALLTARGLDAVDVLGGTLAWAEAGLPLVAESGAGRAV
ncbi:rhodanese-like domain-containing protein [Streptomyces sp. KAU_LT]|nr:rhodanese-like domain-containing protein [Streptomyces sp. KAU_LT]MDI9835613.1 rhodanese-like domain-containing protein [Streptomyces sp. KAU_LT]